MAEPRRAGIAGYLGPLGQLVELPNVSAQPITDERPASTVTTLSGRVVGFVGPTVRRSWSVTVPGQRPAEAGRLVELLRRSAGPFAWVPPYAQVTNVLTPAQTDPEVAPSGGVLAAGFTTAEGVTVSAVAPSTTSSVVVLGPAPVVGGYSVTGSVYVPGTPAATTVTLRFAGADGTQVGSDVTWSPTTYGTTATRLSVTGVAPKYATTVTVRVAGVSKLARPAITWTPDLLDWAPGQGCAAAMVTDWGGDVRATVSLPGRPRTQVQTFDVVEVG